MNSCQTCCRVKSNTQAVGKLQPLPVPDKRWDTISIDVVSGFPEIKDPFGRLVNAVLVIVDHL